MKNKEMEAGIVNMGEYFENHKEDILTRINGGFLTLDLDGEYITFKYSGYFILLSDVDTFEKVCSWVAHMLEKSWFTTDMGGELIQAACKGNKLPYRQAM